MTDDFTWEELSKIMHIIKEERTVIMGAFQRLKRIDKNLMEAEHKLNLLILKKNGLDYEA